MTRLKQAISTALSCLFWILAIDSVWGETVFRAETIDDSVAIGYGVVVEDVDGDGKRDILLADKKQFVWYQNPGWQRHVIAENLTERDNVCIAARDIDGDGKCEIAVGAQWNPGDTVNSGSVHYLVAPQDRTQTWTAVELHHEPVVHRMRWVRVTGGETPRFALVVAPLHGRGNRNGAGAGVRLLAYYPPQNPASDAWTTELLDDSLHVTHNFDRGQWDWDGAPHEGEEIAHLGREGAMILSMRSGEWMKQPLEGVHGGGEIRFGRHSDKQRFLATIEPFHGTNLVVYTYPSKTHKQIPVRQVLASDLAQGHAVATADLLQLGADQILVGWRNRNDTGEFGIRLYHRAAARGASVGAQAEGNWSSQWIDRNGIACEDLRVADLDADGDLDIVAAGRSTHNLKVYWNETTTE